MMINGIYPHMFQTLYYRAKIIPYVAYLRDINNEAGLWLFGTSYIHTSSLSYSLDFGFFDGDNIGYSFHGYRNKDYAAIKIKYSF